MNIFNKQHLCTCDVTDLYTMLPQEESIAILKRFLQHFNYTDVKRMTIDAIESLARIVLTENVFNTAMIQAEIQQPLTDKSTLYAAAQFIRQDAINNGGNDDPTKRYIENGGIAMTFGASAGWKKRQWESSINYNRITAHGRYLMPREWGRDPFFTFMPRERNEGFGDVHAFMGKINYSFPGNNLKSSLSGGYFKLPSISNFRLNKYVVPSYTQVNLEARYSFTNALKGLEAQVLAVGKLSGTERLPANARFNKVDMLNYNFILNYHF